MEFLTNIFKTKAYFINKPLFIPEFKGDDGLMKYSMNDDLIFFDGNKTITIQRVSENGIFITNLASLPTWLHWALKPDNKYLKYPSAFHDGLYDNKDIYKRVYSDFLFLETLKVEKCPLWLRWTLFLGVRIFGSSYR